VTAAVLLVVGVYASTASGQEAPLRLTLEEALERADQASPRLAELRARVDAAAAVQSGEAAAARPAIAALGGYTRTNHVDPFALAMPNGTLQVIYPDVPDNYRARLDLQWPIFTAGRTQALRRAAAGERDAANFDVATARAELRLETTRAFWALVTGRQAEDVLARALESADAHVAELRARLQQGLIPPNDLQSAEAQRSRERVLAIEARSRRAIAEADLRRLIGEDSQQRIEPLAVLDPATIASVPGRAEGQRPERQAVASRILAAREREQAAAAGALPQIGVGGGFEYARPNPRIFPRLDAWRDSWDVSVNVSWSLWDGGRRRADQAEAAAATRGLLARSTALDRDLAFEVELRRLEVEAALDAIPAADEGLRAAAEARRVVGERFNAGVATSTEVLDAQTALLQAELDRTRALAAAQLAIARLDRALGQ
jgi:outer membrane protein TolC